MDSTDTNKDEIRDYAERFGTLAQEVLAPRWRALWEAAERPRSYSESMLVQELMADVVIVFPKSFPVPIVLYGLKELAELSDPKPIQTGLFRCDDEQDWIFLLEAMQEVSGCDSIRQALSVALSLDWTI